MMAIDGLLPPSKEINKLFQPYRFLRIAIDRADIELTNHTQLTSNGHYFTSPFSTCHQIHGLLFYYNYLPSAVL